MNLMPKVSVIIPTYNRAHLIQKSIRSVLNQTYKNLELIIVDDSTDDTEIKVKEIKDERLIYIKNQQRMGVSKARNMAIEISTGELIAFQDSDDEWYPDKLEKQVNLLMNSSPDTAAVYCGMEIIDASTNKKLDVVVPEIDFRKSFTQDGLLQTPATQTVVIKKSVLNEVGYFDERLKAAEDTELAVRVSKNYKYAFVNEPLIKVVRNHDSLMGNANNYLFAFELICQKHKDYLHPRILFNLNKVLANYWILKNDNQKAIFYIKNSLTHQFELKTFIQYSALILIPTVFKYFYKKKYKMGIPHPTQPGEIIRENRKDY